MFISVDAMRWVLTDSRSERSARLTLAVIATHCNDDGYCWPSLDTIMRLTRLSKPIVIQAIEKLVELKEITVEKGGRGAGDTNHYYLCAFMEERVNKGKEIEDKGKVSPPIRVYTGLPEEEVLEERNLEENPSPSHESKLQLLRERLDAWNLRHWSYDEHGKRYLISPSSGQKVYEEAVH